MSQLANRAEQMILSESNPKHPFKPVKVTKLKPLMKPGLRKPKIKKVSWSDNLTVEYAMNLEILTESCNTA